MAILKEGIDYYLNEEGLFVFTAAYHLKRGFCCKSGCLHCPYHFNKLVKTETKKQENLNPPDKFS
jgi:hypothetical protein